MRDVIKRPTRRDLLGAIASVGFVSVIRIEPSDATPASMKVAIHHVVGDGTVKKGQVSHQRSTAGRERQFSVSDD